MSHTTEISSIVFSDVEALRLAVQDLQKAGVKCTLKEKATPRAYFSNQAGMGPADYVLELQDSPYDVGFYYDTKLKGMVARTDLFLGNVARVLGVPPQANEKAEQAALGKLYHAYAVNATTRQATRQGYSVRRVTRADGSVQLIMNV